MAERRLGKYRLLRPLATGGMAELWVAVADGFGGFEKQLALKLIHPNYSADPEFVQMLVDEAKLAVQLQHANIVQTFDLGKVDGNYYIVMELIDGVDLHKILKRTVDVDKYIPFEMAAYIAGEVAAGLDYAHRKRDDRGQPLQIVHRDISPQNVLCSFAGQVKIVDFGIAKAARRRSQTAAGVIKGKYFYMSPEQAWGDPIDGRTDIFSTGILLYEMLAGEMLYYEDDFDKLLDLVRKAEIAPPTTRRKGVPKALSDIAMRALEKRPRDRFPTGAEMHNALAEWLRAEAPEFTPGKLGHFVDGLLETKEKSVRTRAPQEETGEIIEIDSLIDENSLIFRLSDLKPKTPKPKPAQKPVGRREPTKESALPQGDYDEPDETLVDRGIPRGLFDSGPGSAEQVPADTTPGRDLNENTARVEAASLVRLDEDRDPETTAQERPHKKARDLVRPSAAASGGLPGVRAPSSSAIPEPISSTQERVRAVAAPPRPRPSERPVPAGAPTPSRSPPRPQPGPDPDEHSTEDLGPPLRARSNDAERVRPRVPEAPQQRQRPIESGPAPLPSTPSMPELVAPTLSEGNRATTGEMPTTEWNFAAQSAAPAPQFSVAHNAAAQATNAAPPIVPLSAGAQGTSAPVSPPQPPKPQPVGWPWAQPGSDLPPAPAEHTVFTHDVRLVKPRSRRWVWVVFGLVVAGLIAGLSALLFGPILPSRGVIEVLSVPSGAAVKLDAHEVPGVTPLKIDEVELKQSHHVSVSLGGYDTWERDVSFEWGRSDVALHAVLSALTGSLHIESQPDGAEVIVNGRFRGVTPLEVDDLLPTQNVTVELRLNRYRVERRTLPWLGKRSLSLTVPLVKMQ